MLLRTDLWNALSTEYVMTNWPFKKEFRSASSSGIYELTASLVTISHRGFFDLFPDESLKPLLTFQTLGSRCY